MTIKKTMKIKPAAEASAETGAPDVPMTGGATIADRFKLDLQDPVAAKPKSGLGDTLALVAALAGLAAAGFLIFTLWQHWEFLMPA